MSKQTFTSDYDRTIYATRKELAEIVGKPQLFVALALTNQSVVSVGTLRTGKQGKPPEIFMKDEGLVGIKAYTEAQELLEASRAALRAVKAKATNADTIVTPAPANEEPEVATEESSDIAVNG